MTKVMKEVVEECKHAFMEDKQILNATLICKWDCEWTET